MRIAVTLLAAGLCGCGTPAPGTKPEAKPAPSAEAETRDAAGIHNLRRISDKLLSGSSPEGDAGFASLRVLGVKTIITVDGTKPDVVAAGRFGMRYVHIPIGYDSVPQPAAWRIAKAVRDLPGLVYIHCHHGQHRGPAAAATAWLCLDDRCTVQTAVEAMRLAGTDPEYAGLYASPAAVKRPTPADLDALPADFPETAPISKLADQMVAIDGRWDNLQAIRKAGWRAPSDLPGIDPPHEALQLREHFREAARLPGAANRPERFRRLLADTERAAGDLQAALKAGDVKSAEAAFKSLQADCKTCHGEFRNKRR